jgi:hypothetical protein
LLGPSILFASPPFCTAYAFHACRLAKARFAARVGLTLAGVELLVLVTLMVYGALVADIG